MIQFKNVGFTYAGTTASEIGVKHIDLFVETGECVLLCGRSGCGKTTITKLINGLIPNPDKPEKLFLFSTPCVILKKKGVFICYSLINTLIKFMASLPVMTA